ncbi:hypothetical protein HAX54_018260 [Datura stramonium]|uniref:CCT domain-containing protein n=1 Tax=Datura stramonium TaxID=4076 RepID=A0ABS8S1V4_DATST|nr:hypothetical protein [Datura stramonium]
MSHKTHKNIPVVLMSSHDSVGLVFKCLSKGAADFLVKPKGERMSSRTYGSMSGEDAILVEVGARVGNAPLGNGSDDGSDTQSSWTKKAVEAECFQAVSPCDQAPERGDSTCAQVVRSNAETSAQKEITLETANLYRRIIRDPELEPKNAIKLPACFLGTKRVRWGILIQMQETPEYQSLNRSASGSNHGSNGQNGSSNAENAGGTNGNSDAKLAGTSRSGDDASGSGSGNSTDSFKLVRAAALTKFRQKRKERCFEKKVRYHNRKKLAEQRPRVRGQFVRKIEQNNPTNTADEMSHAIFPDLFTKVYPLEDLCSVLNIFLFSIPRGVCYDPIARKELPTCDKVKATQSEAVEDDRYEACMAQGDPIIAHGTQSHI